MQFYSVNVRLCNLIAIESTFDNNLRICFLQLNLRNFGSLSDPRGTTGLNILPINIKFFHNIGRGNHTNFFVGRVGGDMTLQKIILRELVATIQVQIHWVR